MSASAARKKLLVETTDGCLTRLLPLLEGRGAREQRRMCHMSAWIGRGRRVLDNTSGCVTCSLRLLEEGDCWRTTEDLSNVCFGCQKTAVGRDHRRMCDMSASIAREQRR